MIMGYREKTEAFTKADMRYQEKLKLYRNHEMPWLPSRSVARCSMTGRARTNKSKHDWITLRDFAGT